jgi:hypothetical protein
MNERISKVQYYVYPLINFESDVEKLDFGDGILLRRISEEEKKKMINLFPFRGSPLGIKLFNPNFALEFKVLLTKTEESVTFNSPLIEELNVLLALRLFKQGFVDTPYEFYLDRTRAIFGCGYSPNLLRNFQKKGYSLMTTETSDFLRLYSNLKGTRRNENWVFPLEMFSRSYDQDSSEDKIVTFCTALESIFFYGEEKAIEPAGKVIGISVGMLLGRSQKERQEIKEEIVAAYELRNSIVHANLKKLEKHGSRISRVSDKAEEYLRRSLRKLLEEET